MKLSEKLLLILKLLMKLPLDIWLMMISHFPGEVGYILRYKFWKKRLRYLGKNVRIDTGVYFQNPEYIHIDDNCWIDKNVRILAGLDTSSREKVIIRNREYKGEPGVVFIGKNIHIGLNCIISGISAGVYISDNCGFSADCKIYAFSHHYRSKKDPAKNVHFGPMVPHNQQCIVEGAIFIGFNVGFALNVVILPGVSIPQDCFVAINSVVHPGRYHNNSIISGNPAKEIDKRFKEKDNSQI